MYRPASISRHPFQHGIRSTAENKMSINEGADEIANRTSRRRLLRQIAGASLALPLAPFNGLPARAFAPHPARRAKEPPPLPPSPFSPADDQSLDELERTPALFSCEQANPEPGLVDDRRDVGLNH